jgi:hypothetical protein
MRYSESEEDVVTEALHGMWYVAILIVALVDLALVTDLIYAPPASSDIRYTLYTTLILSSAVPLSLFLSIFLERSRRGRSGDPRG